MHSSEDRLALLRHGLSTISFEDGQIGHDGSRLVLQRVPGIGTGFLASGIGAQTTLIGLQAVIFTRIDGIIGLTARLQTLCLGLDFIATLRFIEREF